LYPDDMPADPFENLVSPATGPSMLLARLALTGRWQATRQSAAHAVAGTSTAWKCFSTSSPCIPVVDISSPDAPQQLYDAWSTFGAFQAVGHGISPSLQKEALELVSRILFDPPSLQNLNNYKA
jgi:hypothetical protein